MNVEEIVTKYDSSILVRRWAALWKDCILFASIFLAADGILGNELYRKTISIWIGIVTWYYPVLEGFSGFSLGKIILRIKVVDENGNVPGIGKAIMRTLMRLVETNPLLAGGLPAGIAVLVSKKRQRLGDMWAKTYVVKTKDLIYTS